ncbi:MAG TPA: polyphenol oxidase family protein [Coriobacteriia bacterium]|nr:polyphenol oxidase family protein [Coriobacteriia bacterium]
MESARLPNPELGIVSCDGVVAWTDHMLRKQSGVVVAFSERTGGVSASPYGTLNLAAHVGDSPDAVDENRRRLLKSLGLGDVSDRLITAEQVHSSRTVWVDEHDFGAGARAGTGKPPVPETDALLTGAARLPLLMCFADCVPLVLVAPRPAIAVVHAGWRGALDGLPGLAAKELCSRARCDADELVAYIGAHIGSCHYEVGPDILSQFVYTFGTLARVRTRGLDLDAVVRQSLTDAGVSQWRITSLGACTAEETHRFFSYRAEQGVTGRHGALACLAP